MRKKLTLALYLLCVDLLSYMLVVAPAYSFQVSSSTTGDVRIASQAATQAMITAQRSATLAAVAPLISGTSAGSVAVRMVASSAGWPALGIVAGMALAMLYYNSTKVAAIKAATTTNVYTIPNYTIQSNEKVAPCAPSVNGCVTGYDYYITAKAAAPYDTVNGCNTSGLAGLNPPTGWQGWFSLNVNGVIAVGTCVAYHLTSQTSTAPTLVSTSPGTAAQIQTYIASLPANDPNSFETNTTPQGAQVTPTPADSTASQPVDSTGLPNSVVPATQVGSTDLVLDPNATQPTGTQTTTPTTTQPSTSTSTKTTTTTTNPDGSVTTVTTSTDSDTAVASCTSGNHEQRTFGSILEAHITLWQGTGLLSALNLLKTLTWPSTPPTYTLTSSLFGNYTIDFSPWNGMLTAIRSIIIALAGFVAYRIVFVGSK